MIALELQLLAARMEITRLSDENSRFRSMLTHLTSEYHTLQMHVVASMQRQNVDSGTHLQKVEADSRPDSGAASPESSGLPPSPASPDHQDGWQANKAQKIAHNGVMIPTGTPITQMEADSNVKKARVSVRARSDAPTVSSSENPILSTSISKVILNIRELTQRCNSLFPSDERWMPMAKIWSENGERKSLPSCLLPMHCSSRLSSSQAGM
jgi:hypothetical protein